MEKNENGLSALFRNGNGEGVGGATTREGCGGNTQGDGVGSARMREGCGGNAQGECNGGCNTTGNGMRGTARQLAMVYSPMHCFRMMYSPEEALMRGTLFEELYKPLEEEC